MNRAALYARISTKEGKQHLENQLLNLREFAGRMKWTEAAVYTDQDSGAKDSRPGLDQAMKDAARRRFDVLLVFDLSRLTRGGPMKAFSYISRLKTSGVEFWSATEEHFRTAGPFGEVFLAIAAHIAQAERTTLQARIKAGLLRARKSGRPLGRPPAVFDMDRARRMMDEGRSIREIAKVLKVTKSAVHRRMRTA